MTKTNPPYAPEFRRQMVELVRDGRNPESLSKEFALGPDHLQLGLPDGPRRGAGRWRDQRGARGADPPEAREPPAEA